MDHSLPICRHRRILVNVHSVPLRALYRFCPGIEPQAGFFGQRPYLLSQITRSVPGNGRERGRRRTKATALHSCTIRADSRYPCIHMCHQVALARRKRKQSHKDCAIEAGSRNVRRAEVSSH